MKPTIIAVISLVVAPMLAGLLAEAFKPSIPAAMPWLATWSTMIIEWWLTPWVVGAGCGLLLGLWLDRVSSAFDSRHPMTTRGKAKKLGASANILAARCDLFLSSRLYHGPRDPAPRILVEAFLLGEKLQRLGIDEVVLREGAAQDEKIWILSNYFHALGPALAEGNLRAAQFIARSMRREAGGVDQP